MGFSSCQERKDKKDEKKTLGLALGVGLSHELDRVYNHGWTMGSSLLFGSEVFVKIRDSGTQETQMTHLCWRMEILNMLGATYSCSMGIFRVKVEVSVDMLGRFVFFPQTQEKQGEGKQHFKALQANSFFLLSSHIISF